MSVKFRILKYWHTFPLSNIRDSQYLIHIYVNNNSRGFDYKLHVYYRLCYTVLLQQASQSRIIWKTSKIYKSTGFNGGKPQWKIRSKIIIELRSTDSFFFYLNSEFLIIP